MNTPDGLPPLREVIAELGLSARKRLGQNFILDLNITGKIANLHGSLTGKTVVEVGPGPGGLTRALLLAGADKVIAIEKDQRCIPALEAIGSHYPGRLEIIADDALQIDYQAFDLSDARIIANLPYGVATALLIGWLKTCPWPPWYESMTLMFQREVADRIVARPRSKQYGRLSVLAQSRARVEIVMSLPARAFTPQPKVVSAVVGIYPMVRTTPEFSVQELEKITAAAFGQRRKMLRRSLAGIIDNPEKWLEATNIAPTLRAEELSVTEFCKLAGQLPRKIP
jgi:16S rRNA (adenine1518-N6/adenine1519-N6)-dimethyltransferase